MAVEEIISLNPNLAIKYLDSALSLEPNYPTAFTNKIAAYNQLKDFDNALLTDIKYSKTLNFPVENYAVVAMCYERTGEFEKSITFYKKALQHFEKEEWKSEPLIRKIDFAVLTTFVEGRKQGLKKLEEIISINPLNPQEIELIDRLRNEINYYQGGGYIEIIDNSNIRLFCTTKDQQETFEQRLKAAGINFESWSLNTLTKQYQYNIKPKFASKALLMGLTECTK